MRAVTINSEFSLNGLMVCKHGIATKIIGHSDLSVVCTLLRKKKKKNSPVNCGPPSQTKIAHYTNCPPYSYIECRK